MSKKKHIDYVIGCNDDVGRRYVFRFYPRQSHCHSFGDEPPKSREDVYKVYYSYAFLEQEKDANGLHTITNVVYREYCDECSVMEHIAYCCGELANGKEQYTLDDSRVEEVINILDNEFDPFGYGTAWIIRKQYYTYKKEIIYQFELWDNFDNKGYRFIIPQDRIKEFGEYLQSCCDYMLEHGEGI